MSAQFLLFLLCQQAEDRSGLCNAVNRFLSKAQGAVGASVVGFMLAGIGYVVDSETGDFAGDLAKMPVMLNWFVVIMGLIPFILGMIAWFIERRYPIDNVLRAEMRDALNKAEKTEE